MSRLDDIRDLVQRSEDFKKRKRKKRPVLNENHSFVQFRDKYIHIVFHLCLLGATKEQIAKAFDVNIKTIDAWVDKVPDFKEAIQKGRDLADARVAHALFQSAIGYSCKETTVLTNKIREFNEKGKVIRETTEPLIVETVKNYPPNAMAAIKWLSARQPEKWSEKVQIESRLTIENQIDLSMFSLDELTVLSRLGIGNGNHRELTGHNVELAEYTEV